MGARADYQLVLSFGNGLGERGSPKGVGLTVNLCCPGR